MSTPSLTPSKYSITVTIDDKTLENLKGLKRTLALVRDLNVDGRLQNGNLVLATTEAKDIYVGHMKSTQRKPVSRMIAQSMSQKRLTENPGPFNEARKLIDSKEVSVKGDVDDTKPITVVSSKDNAHVVIGCKNSEDIVTPFCIFPTRLNYPHELTPAQSFFVFFDNAFMVTKTMVNAEKKSLSGHFQFSAGTKDCTVSYTATGDPTKCWRSQDTKDAKKL